MWKKTQDLSVLNPGGQGNQDTTESMIGPSVHLEGNFNSSGNIVIAGSLTGSLTTTGDVRIEEGAKVQASVNAMRIFVAGEVRGDIYALELLELYPSARIFGNIEAKILSVAAGAVLHGKCAMKNAEKHIISETSKVKVPVKKSSKADEVGVAQAVEAFMQD